MEMRPSWRLLLRALQLQQRLRPPLTASIRLLFTMAVMQLRLQQRPANMLQVWLTSLNKHWSGYPVCFADVYFNIFSLFYL